MNIRLWLLLLFLLIMIVDIVVSIDVAGKREQEKNLEESRFRPYLSASILPLYVLAVAVLLALGRRWYVIEETVFRLFGLFLHISVYYLVLMLLLSWLRQRISARVCALLWIIPNYLYLFSMLELELPISPWIIRLPGISSAVLLGIWLLGFAAVLGGQVISHLHFRHILRKSYQTVTDVTMLRLWEEAQVQAGIVRQGDPKNRYIPLKWSEKVKTPLAVGMVRPCMDMVMPVRNYSEEELALIFQHEVIHIGREDSWTKFFLVFCTAMCWFNPLMWFAMRRCAEDVELSCDETVLLGADEETKKQYAQLLLKTVGDERGFTTCLSATGRAMRYRLRQVMDTSEKPMGVVVAAGISVLFCMTCGGLAFSYDHGTATELILGEEPNVSLQFVSSTLLPENVVLTNVEEEIYRYLSGLEIYRLSGSYEEAESEHTMKIRYNSPNVYMTLSDRQLRVFYFGSKTWEEIYYLEEPVDWQQIQSMLVP